MTQANCLVGAADVGLGAQTYSGASMIDAEEAAVGSNGYGVRMTATRNYHNWFTQAFTGNDTTRFNSGHLIIPSVSNPRTSPGPSTFTWKNLANGVYDTDVIAMWTRVAAYGFDAAVAGGSLYGGLTQAYVMFDMAHEIDRESPHPGLKLFPGDTAADFRNAWIHVWNLWADPSTGVAQAHGVATSRVRWTWIITPWNLGTADNFYPGDKYVDVIGFDPYASSTGTAFSAIAPGMFTYARNKNKPIGFAEINVLHTADSTALQNWWIDAAAQINALDIAVEYVCVWPAGPNVEGASYYQYNYNKVADTNGHAFPLGHAGYGTFITNLGGNPIRTSVGQAAPAAPTGLGGSSSTDGTQETLTWSANPGGDNPIGWKVFRADGWVGAGGVVVGTLNAATPRSFTDTGRTPGAKYTYWVACVNASPGTGVGPVGAPIQIQTNNPSDPTNKPSISASSAVATAGSQSVVFSATATSPLGRPLTYSWSVRNSAGTVIDTFSGTSVTRTYQTMGHYPWTLTVADNGTPALANTASDSFDLILNPVFTSLLGYDLTSFEPGAFLETHGQALIQIFGRQDLQIGSLVNSVGEAGELYGSVGQTFDPSLAGASSTSDLASGKVIWAKLKCRSSTISSINTITTQAQIGTGSLVAICDVFGNILTVDGTLSGALALYSGTNVDAWLTHAAGDTTYQLDAAISGLGITNTLSGLIGKDITIAVFSPPTTVTQYAKFVGSEAPTNTAIVNGNSASPIFGSATGQTTITNPLPLGSYVAINKPLFILNA